MNAAHICRPRADLMTPVRPLPERNRGKHGSTDYHHEPGKIQSDLQLH